MQEKLEKVGYSRRTVTNVVFLHMLPPHIIDGPLCTYLYVMTINNPKSRNISTTNWFNCFLIFFLAQQAVEKIDRTRGHAAQLFAKMLTSPLDIPHIPRKSEVLLCFPEKLRQPGKVLHPKYYKH